MRGEQKLIPTSRINGDAARAGRSGPYLIRNKPPWRLKRGRHDEGAAI